MILADNETRVDLLNNEAIAATIIALLRERPDSPVTVGVHGDWGAGKSSILEMIEAGFEAEEKAICLKFNGWRFQGFEDAKIALIEGIVNALVEKRPALTKAGDTVKNVFKSIDWLKVAKHAGGLAFTSFTGIPSPDLITGAVGALEGLLSDPGQVVTKENLSTTIDGVKSVLKPAETKNVPEEIEEFRKAFDDLLKAADVDQLVVLIDDLDRCLPDIAIETLEAIRLFVFTARTAFVVAADEAMIEYAVRKHFPDLPDTTGPRDYARNYLEKLIQVPFRIPVLGETETRIYVTLLLAGAEIGEDDADYLKLIEAARLKLKRPWVSAPLDAATIKEKLGEKADRVSNALMLSDQIGPILASGANGNPRQIKRFLNTLLLRQATSNARGFGEEIKLPVLAKLMLAERFIPNLFEQVAFVAVSHTDGVCNDLSELEKFVALKEGETPEVSSKAKSGKVTKSVKEEVQIPGGALLAEWKSSEAILAWARVQPPIGEIDLRPYLFATKDKKDYFGPASVLGHLASVAEKLFGPKLVVQGLEGELKKLALPEADKLFEAVRTRIMSHDDFGTKPIGVDGLITLVKAHPDLQDRLMDFIKALPAKKCGPWVVGGWQGVLTSSKNQTSLAQQIKVWSEVDDNQTLKVAAQAVTKTPKGVK